MAKLLIQSLGCPNCGADYESESRNCRYCGSVLIVTSLAETFDRDLESHKVSESIDKWRQRLKEDGDSAEAHFALGLSYLNSGLRDAALNHLRQAALLAPEVADTHYNLALTLLNDGNIQFDSREYTEAVKAIDYSIRLAPDFGEAVAFKHFFLAQKLGSIDTRQALAEYREAVAACPTIALIQNNLGICYLSCEDLHSAATCFQRTIELDPRFAMAYSNLCLISYQLEKYQQGVEMGGKAVSLMGPATLEHHQALAHSNFALCLWKCRKKQKAIEHARKAVALEPSNALFQQNLKAIEDACFVVTATMGDYSHPWVVELSTFRDQVLARYSIGTCLIRCYSHAGPIAARLIAPSLLLRRLSLLLVVIPAVCIARLSAGAIFFQRRQ